MFTNLTPPWWSRWLPSAAHTLRISSTGVTIRTRTGIETVDWSAISPPPKRSPLWFLHVAFITTPLGTKRLYFRTVQQRDSAWKALVRAWFTPRVAETQSRLEAFDQWLKDSRYVRTSRWETLKGRVTRSAPSRVKQSKVLVSATLRIFCLKMASSISTRPSTTRRYECRLAGLTALISTSQGMESTSSISVPIARVTLLTTLTETSTTPIWSGSAKSIS